MKTILHRVSTFLVSVVVMLLASGPTFAGEDTVMNDQEFDRVKMWAYQNPLQEEQAARKEISEAEQRGDQRAKLKALGELFEAYGVTEEASKYPGDLAQAIKLATDLQDKPVLSDFLLHQSWVEFNSNHLAKAADLIKQAETLTDAPNTRLRLAWIYFNESLMVAAQGKVSDANKFSFAAYSIFSELHNGLGMANIVEMFGLKHRGGIEENKLAEAEYQKALGLFDHDKYPYMEAELYQKIAKTYFDQSTGGRRDNAQAKHYLSMSIAIFKRINVATCVAYGEGYLADIELDLQQYAAALELLDHALPIVLAGNNGQYNYAFTQVARAQALVHLGRAAEAFTALKAAGEIQQKLKNARLDVTYFQAAAEIYQVTGDYANAYKNLKDYTTAQKHISEIANAKLAEETKVRFDVKVQEDDIAVLKAEADKTRNRNLAVILGFLLALLTLVFVVFLFRRRAKLARIESQYHHAIALAEASANKAKSTFLAHMSHELRSPLNSVIGFSRLLMRDEGQSAQSRENLKIILKNGEHLYALINEILDIAKIESGRVSMNMRDVDLFQILEEMEEIFSLPAADKGLQLKISADAGIPRLIQTDAVRLRQILTNLLGNSIKFTNEGEIELTVQKVVAAAPSEGGSDRSPFEFTLRFTVSDTGVGISPEDVNILGAPFVQAGSVQQKPEGTGLGLAICRGYVDLFGGEFDIRSALNQGTQVSFTLPTREGNFVGGVGDGDDPNVDVTQLAKDLERRKILVVDDSEDGRRLLMQMLSPLGFELRAASNGAEAIAVWLSWPADLIFMDLRMDILDGKEATRRIRAMRGGSTPIIVALTASGFGEDYDALIAEGFDEYFTKPFLDTAIYELLCKRFPSHRMGNLNEAIDVSEV